MCIAIYNPADAPDLTLDTLEVCAFGNPDGMGMAFPHDGKVQVLKTLENLDWLHREYTAVRKQAKPVLLHFRLATHGKVDLVNCHPFYLTPGLAFAHNGVLRGYGDKGQSDTRHFARDVLPPLTEHIAHPKVQMVLAEIIGPWNKFLFLNSKGEATIVNEDKGLWHAGSWFSNSGFQGYRYPTVLETATAQLGYWVGQSILCEECALYNLWDSDNEAVPYRPDPKDGDVWCDGCGVEVVSEADEDREWWDWDDRCPGEDIDY